MDSPTLEADPANEKQNLLKKMVDDASVKELTAGGGIRFNNKEFQNQIITADTIKRRFGTNQATNNSAYPTQDQSIGQHLNFMKRNLDKE